MPLFVLWGHIRSNIFIRFFYFFLYVFSFFYDVGQTQTYIAAICFCEFAIHLFLGVGADIIMV